jgi:hypothetical protein
MSYPFILQGGNLTIVIDNTPHTIHKSHLTYQTVINAIKANDWETVKESIEPKKLIVSYAKGNVTIEGDSLLWNGKELHNSLATRLIGMLTEGFDIDPMVNFMHNLMRNPSKRSVQELYGFLEKNSLPITPDGYFLAYKKVRANYFDVHSGTMDNSVGKVVEMARNEVDDDKDRTCSSGLHFCSKDYLNHFGGERVVIVKIDPADVVSIPSDYNDSKGRTCRYTVIGEVDSSSEGTGGAFTKAVQSNAQNATKVIPVQAPVHSGPKTGSTPFYKGYTDGYFGEDVDCVYANTKDRTDYFEGYEKGSLHDNTGMDMRYRYVTLVVTAPVSQPKVTWPDAVQVTQDYDKFGRPLSMTKDAIRKREARKAEKLQAAQAAKVAPKFKGLWPAPKN